MRVEDMKALIQDLPDDMMIIMPVAEKSFLTVCNSKSGVASVEFSDAKPEDMLVLYPCTCERDAVGNNDFGEINPN